MRSTIMKLMMMTAIMSTGNLMPEERRITGRDYKPEVIPKGCCMYFFDALGNSFVQKHKEPYKKPDWFTEPIVYKTVAKDQMTALHKYQKNYK